MTIVEFLEARIAEDEAAAHEPRGLHWSTDSCYDIGDEDGNCVLEVGYEGGYDFEGNVIAHMARWDPARVLAECAAKRAILSHYAETCRWAVHRHCGQPAEYSGMAAGLGDSLRHLAAVYSDHPDYDKDWAL